MIFESDDIENLDEGRKIKHSPEDRQFTKDYFSTRNLKSNMAPTVDNLRAKFLKIIRAHDATLLKGIADVDKASLKLLKSIIDKNHINVKQRLRNWYDAEKDICEGINELLKTNFFSYENANGKTFEISPKRFRCELAGGAIDSDVKISRISDPKKFVCVESKLNFLTSNYFKFELDVKNGQIVYDYKFFMQGDDDARKARI